MIEKEGDADKALEENGEGSEEHLKAEREYYKQKAKVDYIDELIDGVKKQQEEAKAKLDEATVEPELDE